MALKFLNKKGWHTGSLRNIENVWKAEQKNDAEKKKLEELRKQIQEERERSEFRQLQEQAGLIPRQERLDFLYESGLAVGKGSSDGFKALEAPSSSADPSAAAAAAATEEGSASKAATPGALFEDKPQSANDAWRKLHSDPLLLIRQREQEALARIKNNPIRMAMIRKSVEAEKKNKQDDKVKKKKKQHKRKHKKSNEKDSVSETSSESEEATQRGHHLTSERQAKGKRSKYPSNVGEEEEGRRKDDNLKSNRKHSDSKHEKHSSRIHSDSRYSSESEEDRRKGVRSISEHHSRHPSNNVKEEERRKGDRDRLISDHKHGLSKHVKHSSGSRSDSKYLSESEEDRRKGGSSISEQHHKYNHSTNPSKHPENEKEKRKHVSSTSDRYNPSSEPGSGNKNWDTQPQNRQGPGYNRRRGVPKMTEEEREARLREMQLDAELHEEQRWKRVKKAAEADARESARASSSSGGKNFLDAAQKSIYGTEKGGSSTIEESVRRRAYFSQGGTAANESNAFRR